MTLSSLVVDVAEQLVRIDKSLVPFKEFSPGVGPYGEPQLVKAVAQGLRSLPEYQGTITKRTPDLLIPKKWAIEIKIARPFGDNGKEAENWSVNLLHPYPGNVSVIGDCLKLQGYQGTEKRAVLVVGYEHTPPQIQLDPLIACFEVIARSVMQIEIGERNEVRRAGLVHPVHQQLVVAAWEVSYPSTPWG